MVHTNSDSAKREKEADTFAICVRTMWYEEKVSNFEIAVHSKIERNIAKRQICHTLPEHSVGTSLWPPKIVVAPKDSYLDQNMIPFTLITHLL